MARLALLLVCATLCSLGPATLRADDGVERAREEMRAGIELLVRGRPAEAKAAFERAYALHPHHGILYNLGLTYVMLGERVRAVETLEGYLAGGGSAIDAARRVEVLEELAQQRAGLGELRILVEPAAATLTVDGADVVRARRVLLLPGEHHVAARHPGHRSVEQQLIVAAGDDHVVELTLEALAPARPAAPPPTSTAAPTRIPPSAPTAEDDATPLRTAGYVLGGVGLAGGFATLAVAIWNEARYGRWLAAQRTLDAGFATSEAASAEHAALAAGQDENDALLSSVHDADLAVVTAGVVSGALAAAGIGLWLGSRVAAADVTVAASPCGLAIVGRF